VKSADYRDEIARSGLNRGNSNMISVHDDDEDSLLDGIEIEDLPIDPSDHGPTSPREEIPFHGLYGSAFSASAEIELCRSMVGSSEIELCLSDDFSLNKDQVESNLGISSYPGEQLANRAEF
jgi:hypothetical protein